MLTLTFLLFGSFWQPANLPDWMAELNPTADFELSWLERRESKFDRSLPLARARLGLEPHLHRDLSLGLELATWSDEFRDQMPLSSDGDTQLVSLGKLFANWHQEFSRVEWTVDLGKFESPLFASSVMWDPELRPVGLFQSVELKNENEPLRLALYSGQISLDQSAQNLVQGSPQRRSWLFEQGIVAGWQQPYGWKLRIGVNSFYYWDLSEKLAREVRQAGNTISSVGAISQFNQDYAPIEFIAQLQSNPYGILMRVTGSYILNLLADDRDQAVFLELAIGNAWAKNELRTQLAYFFIEPDANFAGVTTLIYGQTNRHGTRVEVSYFPLADLRTSIHYSFADTVKTSLDQATRNEWGAQMEVRF